MPFLGRDWRSPGNLWVRTSSGWQKVSTLKENLNRHVKRIARESISVNLKKECSANKQKRDGNLPSTSISMDHSQLLITQNKWNKLKFSERPKGHYLFIPNGCGSSRQHASYLTVGEALCSFDFCTALSDPRRFHYVCKVVELIVENHFVSLSGSAVKYLFFILEEAVNIVESSHLFLHRIVKLLLKTRDKMIVNKRILIGSTVVKNCRLQTLNGWLQTLQDVNLKQRTDDGKATLSDLPDECQQLLLQCFTEAADIIHVGQTCKSLYSISNDNILWHNLCLYHFNQEQLLKVIRIPPTEEAIEWKALYKKLNKRHERREEYASMLQKCCHCNCIYWQDGGHPCSMETTKAFDSPVEDDVQYIKVIDITPKQLLAIFNNNK